jgi:hypothetical protein
MSVLHVLNEYFELAAKRGSFRTSQSRIGDGSNKQHSFAITFTRFIVGAKYGKGCKVGVPNKKRATATMEGCQIRLKGL